MGRPETAVSEPVPRDRGRVIVEAVTPEVDAGRFPIKRVVGEVVEVEADVFTDGHEHVAAALWVRAPGDPRTREIPMDPRVNDRFGASFVPESEGRWAYTVVGWLDHYATWRDGTRRKVEAGQDVAVDLRIGARLVGDAAERAGGGDALALQDASSALAAGDVGPLTDDALGAIVARWADREPIARHSRTLEVVVDRAIARCSAWYEFFPRSTGPEPGRHGTFADAAGRLPDVAAMGFDVVYLPPIHPIGVTYRKGRNNVTEAGPDDVGSPWGIGAAEGGHTEIHPALGTLADFVAFREAAEGLGLEVALDLAFQCTPDHPWVREHPQWFRHRPDGTIQYAENPPKRYQDIYPIDFDTDDWEALWDELLAVVLTWVERGVRIFRVDNPHTKPFHFWEWLISAVKAIDPGVLFLAEAFTRPKVMHRLAKLGFTWSYTYFTWRQTASELREYFTELTTPPLVDAFRPSAWPNTPDILTEQLQHGGRAVFVQRLVLAATLSANYGIYGPAFELCENRAVRPGSEEYLDSEKYQLRRWDLDAPHSLRELITLVNQIRHAHPALRLDRSLRFHATDNDELLCYSKTSPDGDDVVLVVVNVDPHHRQSGWIQLDLDRLGVAPDHRFDVHDLLGGARYAWQGTSAFVELDPHVTPAHVFAIGRPSRSERDFEAFA